MNFPKNLMELGFRYEKDCLSKKERTTCIGNGYPPWALMMLIKLITPFLIDLIQFIFPKKFFLSKSCVFFEFMELTGKSKKAVSRDAHVTLNHNSTEQRPLVIVLILRYFAKQMAGFCPHMLTSFW